MGNLYVRTMDRLYWACITIAVISMIAMTGLICVGVFLRYIFAMGAQFAEPVSIFFAIQLAFYGAAACLRTEHHLSLQAVQQLLPERWQRTIAVLVHALLGLVALAMIVYGVSLVDTTWFQSYPEFEYVKVGLVYTAIPGSGVVTLLFVIESLLFRDPEQVRSRTALAQTRRKERAHENFGTE